MITGWKIEGQLELRIKPPGRILELVNKVNFKIVISYECYNDASQPKCMIFISEPKKKISHANA